MNVPGTYHEIAMNARGGLRRTSCHESPRNPTKAHDNAMETLHESALKAHEESAMAFLRNCHEVP